MKRVIKATVRTVVGGGEGTQGGERGRGHVAANRALKLSIKIKNV